MTDILRILSMTYGKLWLSEIVNEVNAFRRTLNDYEKLGYDDALSAIEELKKLNVIDFERRLRSSLVQATGIEDFLVDLTDRDKVLSIVYNDEKYRRYMKIKREIYDEIKRNS